jgi:hypothetical protein
MQKPQAGVGAPCPVSVGVGNQLVDRPSADVEASRQCALHIPKYVLDQRKVSFARIMHEEAHLLHSVLK